MNKITNMKILKLSKIIKENKFDWVNSDITDDLFPVPNKVSNDFKLFNFNGDILSENVIKEMNREGYQPANAWELLSWKDWNNKDCVVGLGSVGEVFGYRDVPCLSRDDSERSLRLSWWGGGWGARCRFLGVRNSPEGTMVLETELRNSDTLNLESALKLVKKEGYKIYKEI